MLLQELQPPCRNAFIENDARTDAGTPILFCYLPDLPRLFRFLSALELLQMKGAILCFDFQANALQPLCGDRVELQTIDFAEFERRFFSTHETTSKTSSNSIGSRAAALCLRLRNAVHRQLCRLAEKRRYAGRHFSAVSLFVAAGLSQRCSVVSYNLYCTASCAAAVAVIFLYRKLFSQDALTDSERNFDFSAKALTARPAGCSREKSPPCWIWFPTYPSIQALCWGCSAESFFVSRRKHV